MSDKHVALAHEKASFDKWAWERDGDPIGTLSPSNAAVAAWFARAAEAATALSAQEAEIERLKECTASARDALEAIAQLSVSEVMEPREALERIITANKECAKNAILELRGAGIRLADGGSHISPVAQR